MATTSSDTSPNFEDESQALSDNVEISTIPANPTEDLPNVVLSDDEAMESEPNNNLSPRQVTPSSPTLPYSSPTHSISTSRVARRIIRSPRTNPYPEPITIGSTSNHAHRLNNARSWGWLSTTLNAWRTTEEIQTTPEPLNISPYTQEPMHHTVPVLAARLYRHENRLNQIIRSQDNHEHRLDAVEIEQHENHQHWIQLSRGRVAQMYEDQMDITETVRVVHNQVINNSNEIIDLQSNQRDYESRIMETENLARSLEQQLKEAVRMIGRLTETIERITTLLPPPIPPQD